MSDVNWDERRARSQRLWADIRRRIEELERAEPEAEADLAGLWHRRAVELAEAPDRDRERGEQLPLVVVRLGSDRYAVPITSVREIQRVGRITRVSTAPAFVSGVINLRGVILAVLDLRVVFGLEAGPVGEGARILIAESGGAVVGVLVERIEEIVDVPSAEVRPPLAPAKGAVEDYVSGIAAHGGTMVVLIDLDKVLSNPRIVVDEAV